MKRKDIYDATYTQRRKEGIKYTASLRRDLININGINHIYKCEHCGVEGILDMFALHHKVPIAEGGEPMGEIELLCEKCHDHVHGRENHSDKPKPHIEKDDWVQFAIQKLNQKDIVIELNTTIGEVQKAWNRDGKGMNWSQFKKLIKKGISFDEAIAKHIM